MTIKRLLLGALLSLGLVAVGLGIFIVSREQAEMSKAQIAALRLEALRALGNIPATVNLERGLTTIALQASSPSSDALKALADARTATDAAIATARKRTADMQGRIEDASALISDVAKIIDIWMSARQFADDQMQVPLASRGNAVAALIDQSATLAGPLAADMATQLRQLADVDGVAFRLASVAATVWEFRDIAGRHAGTLQNFVGARKPLTDEQKTMLAALDAQVNEIWGRLWVLRNEPSTPEAVKSGLDSVKRAYFEEFVAEKKKLELAYATGDFPYDATVYRQKVAPMWGPVIALRDAAYAAAAETIARTNANALFQVQIGYGFIAFVGINRGHRPRGGAAPRGEAARHDDLCHGPSRRG